MYCNLFNKKMVYTLSICQPKPFLQVFVLEVHFCLKFVFNRKPQTVNRKL